jgi:hypothetical protein
VTSPRRASTAPSPARRYLRWPLLLCAAWLGAVAVGVTWPAVLLMLPCVLTAALVGVRGPFQRSPLPQALRAATALVPMIVVAAQNPWYDRFGLNQGQPGVITPAEFWSHVARAEIVALIVVELALLALAGRIDERGRDKRRTTPGGTSHR